MNKGTGQFSRIRVTDLSDPTLFRMNSVLDFIHERLALVEEKAGVSAAPAADQKKQAAAAFVNAKGRAVDLRDAFGFSDTEFTITPGSGLTIKGVDFSKGFNFNTSLFDNAGLFTLKSGGVTGTYIGDNSISTPKLLARAVTTEKLTTSALTIGGAYQGPIQISILNHYGEPVGWIGDDYTPGGSMYDGAWFKRLLVGGTSPATAQFFADSLGNVAARKVFVYDTGGSLGWIGSSDSYTGAWFKKLYVGGSSPANAPLVANSAGAVSITNAKITVTGTFGSLAQTITLDPVGTFYPLEIIGGGHSIGIGANDSVGAMVKVQASNTGNRYPYGSLWRSASRSCLELVATPFGATTPSVSLEARDGSPYFAKLRMGIANLDRWFDVYLGNDASYVDLRSLSLRVGGTERLDSTGNFNAYQKYSVGGNQVVGSRHQAISNPTGGGVVDAEARTATVAILNAMRSHGLIAT